MYKEYWNKMGVLLETNPELINVNIRHYENGEPECIDATLHFKHLISASVSMFLDEPIDSEVVFTIYRDKTLLVADSLPIDDLVERINTAIKKCDEYVCK